MNLNHVTAPYLTLALEYCVNTFGLSKYSSKLPTIKFYPRARKLIGEYPTKGEYLRTTNTISIWKREHKSTVDLLETFIHEYKHYLQNLKRYQKLCGEYEYNSNPYEIAADKLGTKHKWRAKKYITKRLKQLS